MPQQSAAAEPLQRPRLVEVAFALVCVAGLCSLAFAAVLPFQIQRVLEDASVTADRQGTSVAELEQQLVIGVVIAIAIAVVFAALLGFFGFRFRAGRASGRFWIVVLTAIGLVPVLLTPATLLTVVILVAADVLMFLPSVSTWLRRSETARSKARMSGIRPA